MNARVFKTGSFIGLLLAVLALPACTTQPVLPTTGTAVSREVADNRLLVTLHAVTPAGVASLAPSGRLDYQHPGQQQVRAEHLRTAQQLAETFDLQIEDEWEIPSLDVYCFVFRLPDLNNRQNVIAELRQHARVESVQSMQFFHGESSPRTANTARASDPLAEWDANLNERLSTIHRHTTGKSVSIAVIDAGVDMQHEDLLESRLQFVDFVDGLQQIPPEAHGTAVVGLLAARSDNGVGIRGYAPDAEILLIRACWESEVGKEGAVCNSFTLAKALSLAIESSADIVNMSISGPRDPLLERLANELVSRGQILVAAGNSSRTFPGSVSGSILAASCSTDDAALTLLPGNRYGMRNGSSISSARVTGGAALLKQIAPDISAAELTQLWLAPDTATPSIMLKVARIVNSRGASAE